MKRHVLPLVTLGLFAMILADRFSRAFATDSEAPAVQGPNDTRSATVELEPPTRHDPPAGSNSPSHPTLPPSTPTIERLARLAARQELTRERDLTYLDSLILSTDSVVRRWPDRSGLPLRVSIVEGGPPGYHPRMAEFMREAMGRWERAGIGVRFTTVSDTSQAEILVRWIDHFDFDRAGQTDLTWDQAGRVRKAAILLAVRTNTGLRLPDAALVTVAVHEAGHALGLPHSGDANDVMFPATQTSLLSERDRRTAQVLYRLPTGPVRDIGGAP